jgi:hypothetical protein
MLQLSKEFPYDPSVMVHFAQLKRKEGKLAWCLYLHDLTSYRSANLSSALIEQFCKAINTANDLEIYNSADDLVGAASCYGKAIQLFKDQGVHNLAYVRTLLASGSLEVQAGNVAKARSLFTESVEVAVKVISSFLLCVIAFANCGAPAVLVSVGSSSCLYLSWSARSCRHL